MVLTQVFLEAVKAALDEAHPDLRAVHPNCFTPLSSSGLSHDHIRLGESGWLLRIPRGNQLGMAPEAYLALQTDCFTIAAQSGHAPNIAGILPPQGALPDGALVVEEIRGRKSSGPQDAAFIARAMAAIHAIRPEHSSGLQIADHPLSSQHFLISDVFAQSVDAPTLHPKTAALLHTEKQRVLDGIESLRNSDLPFSLIGGDSHPANFMITPDSKAYLVDVEFSMFDVPFIDLADSSLPITQRLDPDITTWPPRVREGFYKEWRSHADADLVACSDRLRTVAEDAVRLRTLLWLADWSTKEQADISKDVTPRARDNWDRMASTYLEPSLLSGLLQGKRSYPRLIPLS